MRKYLTSINLIIRDVINQVPSSTWSCPSRDRAAGCTPPWTARPEGFADHLTLRALQALLACLSCPPASLALLTLWTTSLCLLVLRPPDPHANPLFESAPSSTANPLFERGHPRPHAVRGFACRRC